MAEQPRDRAVVCRSAGANWGAPIALVGAMLIYAARRPAARRLALAAAGANKAIFIALVLSPGRRFLGYQAGIAVVVDLVWVVVFALYYFAVRRAGDGRREGWLDDQNRAA